MPTVIPMRLIQILCKSLALALCLSILNPVQSQEVLQIDLDQSLKRNAIYGSLGWQIMSGSLSAYAERIIGPGIESWGAETFVRLGIMGFGGRNQGNVMAIDGGVLIPGLSRIKYGLLEIAVGWHPILKGDLAFPQVGGSVAFRYQKPRGHFIFRFGAGIPEVAFIGVGFCF